MIGWKLVKQFVKSGLVSPRFKLFEKESALVGATTKLQAIVPIPEEEIEVTVEQRSRFLAQFKENYRPMVNHLLGHIQIATFKDLQFHLEQCCLTLSKNLKGEAYHVGIIRNKSQEWVANLAYRYLPLEHLPQSVVEIGRLQKVSQFERTTLNLEKICDINGHFVLFDDVSYTGTQIVDFLDLFFSKFKMNKENSAKIHIHIVVPFMSRMAKERVEKAIIRITMQSKRISSIPTELHISLVTNHILKNIKDIVESYEPSQAQQFYQLLDWPSASPQVPVLDVIADQFEVSQVDQKCLCFTQWKKADNVSLPKLFGHPDVSSEYLEEGCYLPRVVKDVDCPYKKFI